MTLKMAMCAIELKEWSVENFGPIFCELKKKRKVWNKSNKGGLTFISLRTGVASFETLMRLLG